MLHSKKRGCLFRHPHTDCLTIFTTAYSEYAIDGFKVDATDYILKPIAYSDFLKSAYKAKEILELKKGNNKDEQEYLFVKSGYKVVRIELDDIKYIESMREYVKIYLDNGSSVMTLMSMKSMEEKLSKKQFMRVHRSFIVSLKKVNVVERQRIIFDLRTYIPVGEQYKDDFEQFLNTHL